jgi:dimethylargininase
LTSAGLGPPDVALASEQHARYCRTLESYGVTLIRLLAAVEYPDSTFIEDTAVVTAKCAVIARPGAPSRSGEIALVEPALRRWFTAVHRIEAPGTLDGGDVCQVGDRFFIGVSERTNEDGACQLAALLAQHGYMSTLIDIRAVPGVLHLKSAMGSLGDNRLTLIDTLADAAEFRGYDIVQLHPKENYAANCLRVNDHVLINAGFPRFESALRELGYAVTALNMSEFRKMDGALTCLSLRF